VRWRKHGKAASVSKTRQQICEKAANNVEMNKASHENSVSANDNIDEKWHDGNGARSI